MEENCLFEIKNRNEFRQWLMENHEMEKECWIVVKRGRSQNDNTFWYVDAVEEALCFGWIDSTTKKLEIGVTVQKFAPRSKNSVWSELNKARCERMEKLGLMTDAGRSAIPKTDFIIDNEILNELKKDILIWDNFTKFPELYKRVRLDTIQIKKKSDPELYKRRLNKFIENTRQGIMFGEWNDNGRLI